MLNYTIIQPLLKLGEDTCSVIECQSGYMLKRIRLTHRNECKSINTVAFKGLGSARREAVQHRSPIKLFLE